MISPRPVRVPKPLHLHESHDTYRDVIHVWPDGKNRLAVVPVLGSEFKDHTQYAIQVRNGGSWTGVKYGSRIASIALSAQKLGLTIPDHVLEGRF